MTHMYEGAPTSKGGAVGNMVAVMVGVGGRRYGEGWETKQCRGCRAVRLYGNRE